MLNSDIIVPNSDYKCAVFRLYLCQIPTNINRDFLLSEVQLSTKRGSWRWLHAHAGWNCGVYQWFWGLKCAGFRLRFSKWISEDCALILPPQLCRIPTIRKVCAKLRDGSVVLRAEMCRIPTVAEPAEKAYLLWLWPLNGTKTDCQLNRLKRLICYDFGF